MRRYDEPAATKYLAARPEAERANYLTDNAFISWDSGSFGWSDFLAHVGAPKKAVPAFDVFDLSSGENSEFGLGKTPARHFTT